ncbi:hypothetical protein [Vibrio sp. 99-8-1]|uniref:hypothetical protein n=1 Tax=Vibrio sp. 99-8-1 TaxID=2607602 RepID=UPI0014935F04|nr:hypothetical protein [Vibrio sp. 99-8-1]NOI65134.1 hypothetical protein [Vibrio sp. 99-8-1]
MKKMNEAQVLVISSTIKDISTISIALQSVGVAEHNIQSVHNYKLALRRVKQPAFDIYIMDYDIEEQREEFYHTAMAEGFLSDLSIKLFVTSDKKSIYGILDLEPDGYLLRPYSASKMKTKITAIYDEKSKLKTLLENLNGDCKNKMLSSCNLLEIFYPKFYYSIMEKRGKVYEEMGEQEVALNLYESMIKRIDDKANHPWLYARYLNSLIQAKKIKKADSIRKHILANKVRMSPELYDTMIDLDICLGSIESAQSKAESICALIPCNYDRKEILSTLYLIQGQYEKAMRLYNDSYLINKDSYRDKPLNLLDYLKSILYMAQKDEQGRHLYLNKFDYQIKLFKYKKLSQNDKWKLELLHAHKRYLEGYTKEVVTSIEKLGQQVSEMSLRTLHHYMTLQGLLGLDTELESSYEAALDKFRSANGDALSRAQIFLIDDTFRSFKEAC